MMTNENGSKIAPAGDRVAPAVRDMRAPQEATATVGAPKFPSARYFWCAGAAGAATLAVVVGSACGGSGETNERNVGETPRTGACSVPIDANGMPARVTLNQAVLFQGDQVKIGNGQDALLEEGILDDLSRGVFTVVDPETGEIRTLIADQNGNVLPRALFMGPDDENKVVIRQDDGTLVELEVCYIGITPTLPEGGAKFTMHKFAVVQANEGGFNWCDDVDVVVPTTETFASGYGPETITQNVQRLGEEASRPDATSLCGGVTDTITDQTITFRDGIPYGAQDFNEKVKVLGVVRMSLERGPDGTWKVGDKESADDLPVTVPAGTSLPSMTSNVVAYVNVLEPMADGAYEATLAFDLGGEAGVSYVSVSGRKFLQFTDNEGKKVGVLISVTADGVRMQYYPNVEEVKDGSVYKGYDVSLGNDASGNLKTATFTLIAE